SPKADDTWFGPNPPLVAKFESFTQVMDGAVTIPARATVAMAVIGSTSERSIVFICACVSWIFLKNTAQIRTARGPDRLKLICSLAVFKGNSAIVCTAEGSNNRK